MKRVLLSVLAGAVLASGPAFGQFEGQIDMKVAGMGVAGTNKIYVSKMGSRSEMELDGQSVKGNVPVHPIALVKSAAPDALYLIDDKARTFREFDVRKAREAVAKRPEASEPYDVKVLGTERFLGYSTRHVLLSRPSGGSEMEVWTTKDITGLSYESMRGLMRRTADEDDAPLVKALRDAGADGFFVKMVTRDKGQAETTTTMELTKAEQRPIPASMFDIPQGYTKEKGTPELIRRIDQKN